MRYMSSRRPPCMDNPSNMNLDNMNTGYMNQQPMGIRNNIYMNNNCNPCPTSSKPYTVMPGENLYNISMKTGVSIDEILAINPGITNPNLIYPGDIICIPYEMTCDGFLYTIKYGDTLYSIAIAFSITVDDLLAANPYLDPNYYQAGEVICIPEPYPCAGNTTLYVVKSNDTLTSILTQCNISINALLGANPGFDPINIVAGTRLCVIPTPCEPMCELAMQKIIPEDSNNIEELAAATDTTTDEILLKNPNYPPCYFKPGHHYCV